GADLDPAADARAGARVGESHQVPQQPALRLSTGQDVRDRLQRRRADRVLPARTSGELFPVVQLHYSAPGDDYPLRRAGAVDSRQLDAGGDIESGLWGSVLLSEFRERRESRLRRINQSVAAVERVL